MNKNWKKGIFFLLLFLAVMPMIHMYREQRMQKEIAEKILRFHVIANSDSREDQELKLKVRDAVGLYMKDQMKEVTNRKEAEETANANLKKIEKVADGKAVITRRIESGVETVEAPLPLVVTVNGSADDCRPRNARRIQKYKYAVTPSEKATMSETLSALVDARPYLQLKEWSADFVDADPEQIGLKGSPTKVKGIVNVVFQAKESKKMDGKDQGAIEDLVKELIANHTIG